MKMPNININITPELSDKLLVSKEKLVATTGKNYNKNDVVIKILEENVDKYN